MWGLYALRGKCYTCVPPNWTSSGRSVRASAKRRDREIIKKRAIRLAWETALCCAPNPHFGHPHTHPRDLSH